MKEFDAPTPFDTVVTEHICDEAAPWLIDEGHETQTTLKSSGKEGGHDDVDVRASEHAAICDALHHEGHAALRATESHR